MSFPGTPDLKRLLVDCEELSAMTSGSLSMQAERLIAIGQALGRNDVTTWIGATLDVFRQADRVVEHARRRLDRSHDLLEMTRLTMELEAADATAGEHRGTLRRSARLLFEIASSITQQRWVISLHGIRTRGVWQKQLTEHLNAAGLMAKLPDYGWFSAARFLFRGSRQAQIEKFRDEYTDFLRMHPGTRPSLVAHSFGSYIAAAGIEHYGMRFDRIVLCGSIVRETFPWSTFLDQGRVNRVLNDVGKRDIWSRVVIFAVSDAGRSGWRGFDDVGGGRVIQAFHPSYGHSAAFFVLNYRERWIPFLLGQDPEPVLATKIPFNWRYWTVRALFVLGLLAMGVFAWLGR